MRIIIYKSDGCRKELTLVHEILEHDEDIACTYTDLKEDVYKSYFINKVDVARISILLD